MAKKWIRKETFIHGKWYGLFICRFLTVLIGFFFVFSFNVIKCPDQSNLREKGLSLRLVCPSWWWGQGLPAGATGSWPHCIHSRGWGVPGRPHFIHSWEPGRRFVFAFFLLSSGLLLTKWCCLQLGCVFPTQLTYSR